jgi:hypothetical protein
MSIEKRFDAFILNTMTRIIHSRWSWLGLAACGLLIVLGVFFPNYNLWQLIWAELELMFGFAIIVIGCFMFAAPTLNKSLNSLLQIIRDIKANWKANNKAAT